MFESPIAHHFLPSETLFVTQDELARDIATKAHAGATRADSVTPYIEHPRRVAELVSAFLGHNIYSFSPGFWTAVSAAWLHDVLEDTQTTANDLASLGVSPSVITVVDLLTKRAEQPTEAYYGAIASNAIAKIVKLADRCSNLEDALIEVRAGRNPERWARYAAATTEHLLPCYQKGSWCADELAERIDALLEALNTHS